MDAPALKDILAGLIFVGFGARLRLRRAGYELGTAFRMGPGYFPLVLAGLLAFLGVAIVARRHRRRGRDADRRRSPGAASS